MSRGKLEIQVISVLQCQCCFWSNLRVSVPFARRAAQQYIQQTLKEPTDTKVQAKSLRTTMAGQLCHPKHSFEPIMKWKNIPDVVLSVYSIILQQLVPTKVHRVKKQKEQGLDLMCPLCQRAEETVPQLLCGCSAIAQTIYRETRYRPVYHLLLSHGKWWLKSVV